MNEQINTYYQNYDEDGRLFRDNAHKTEYLTTVRYLDRVLAPGSRILDACAGTGRYALYLAEKGHAVTACDLVEHNIGIIRSKPGAEKLTTTGVCDVLELSGFADGAFDAVLCMGALYHIRTNEVRRRAVAECARVCRPGGIVALAYITKIGAILANINADASNMDGLIKVIEDTDDRGPFFCAAPCEVEEIALSCDLDKVYNIATDGAIYAVGGKLNAASDENFSKYMEYHYMTCEDESVIGASIHGLWIGRKK